VRSSGRKLALELARQLPQVKFSLAGGPMPGGETYYEDMRAAAARLPNVTMLGAVRYADSGSCSTARNLLNTSSIEGFPILPASVDCGVPVVSFFDPDSASCKRLQLGHIANSVDEMREGIRCLLEVMPIAKRTGARAREFATCETPRESRLVTSNTESELAAGAAGRPPIGQREQMRHDDSSDLPCASHERTAVTRDFACDTRAVARPACDVLFVFSSPRGGGSERKIARLANRLRDEGVGP